VTTMNINGHGGKGGGFRGASFGPSPQSGLTLVSSDLQGMSFALVVTGTTHLLEVS
jgi:hypothetical protein